MLTHVCFFPLFGKVFLWDSWTSAWLCLDQLSSVFFTVQSFHLIIFLFFPCFILFSFHVPISPALFFSSLCSLFSFFSLLFFVPFFSFLHSYSCPGKACFRLCIQSQGSKATSHDRRKEDTLWPLSEMKLTSQASSLSLPVPFLLNIDAITLAAC